METESVSGLCTVSQWDTKKVRGKLLRYAEAMKMYTLHARA